MSMTDPIADMLTRIRNASSAQLRSVDVPASGIKREISRVLAEERFIDNFAFYEARPVASLPEIRRQESGHHSGDSSGQQTWTTALRC